jgi:hypothetical protein
MAPKGPMTLKELGILKKPVTPKELVTLKEPMTLKRPMIPKEHATIVEMLLKTLLKVSLWTLLTHHRFERLACS